MRRRFCFLLILVIATHSSCNISIDDVFTSSFGERRLEGSVAGGTRLWIVGQGFSDDPTNFQNEVFIAGNPCSVVEYLSLPGTLIVADTPSSLNGDEVSHAAIKVRVGSEEATANSVFHYRLQRTPKLFSVTPSTTFPGAEVLFRGDFKDRQLGGERVGYFRRITIGNNNRCVIPDPEDTDQTESQFSSFHCMTPTHLSIGFHNASVVVGRYYGMSIRDTLFHYYNPHDSVRRSYKTNLQGQLYALQVVPRIEYISHHTGSFEGGLALTIYGTGLTGDEVRADIDGIDCPIVAIDPEGESITCVTSASNENESGSVYTGGRGVRRDIFTRVTHSNHHNFEEFDSRQPFLSDILPTTETETNRGSNYEQRLQTIFIPTVSGLHTFYCVVDDIADVFVSSVDDASVVRRKITKIRRYTPRFLPFLDVIRSTPLQLESGKRYLIEVHMAEFSGADFFTLGVSYSDPNSGYQHNSMKEVQKLTLKGHMRREIQRVKFDNLRDGEFRLEYSVMNANGIRSSAFTHPLPWNASASQISQELNSLETTNEHISVSRTYNETESSAAVDFTFERQLSYRRELINVYPKCQVQCTAKTSRVQDGTPPLDGKLTFHFGNNETTSLAIDTHSSHLESLIKSQLLPGQEVTVDVQSSSSSAEQKFEFYVTFSKHEGRVSDLIRINISDVFGGINNNSVETESEVLIAGSSDLYFMPIPSDMLFVPEDRPQLHIYVDGSIATCAAESCTFEVCPVFALSNTGDCTQASQDETPVLTSVVEVSETDGRVLQISGIGLEGGVEITAGSSALCEILSSSDDFIECALPSHAEAGDLVVKANFTDKGLARHQGENAPYSVECSLEIDEVSPSRGSTAGGTHVTITGTGFSNSSIQMEITMDGMTATFLASNATIAVIETPQTDSAKTATGVVQINGVTADFTFTYVDLVSLSSITPTAASIVARTQITITGTGFGTDKDSIAVNIGENECLLDPATELTDDEIVCYLNGGGPPGPLSVKVHISGIGFASGDLFCTFEFEITEISPLQGSIYGGTVLTLSGRGFGSGVGFDENVVSIGNGNPPCEVLSQNYTTIVCVTGALVNRNYRDSALDVRVALRNTYAECNSGNCAFTYRSEISPAIQGLAPVKAGDLETVQISGSGFGEVADLIHVHLVPDSEASCIGASCLVPYSILQYFEEYSVHDLTSSTFNLTLGQKTAGFYRLVLFVEGTGFANASLLLEYTSLISAIHPPELSTKGGILTLLGSGFPSTFEKSEMWIVRVGTQECRILTSHQTTIRCMLSGSFPSRNHSVSMTFETPDNSIMTTACERDGSCVLQIKEEQTPEILSGTIERLENGRITVQLTGNGFNGSDDLLLLKDIPNLNFTVVESTDTFFSVLLIDLPAGVHDILFHVNGSGFAVDSRNVLSGLSQKLVATSPDLATGSLAGGTLLEFHGSGFDVYNFSNNKVAICDLDCMIIAVKFDNLECQTAEFVNLEWSADFALDYVKKLSGSVRSSSRTRERALFDGNLSTYFISGGDCFVELDLSERAFANLTSVVIHPELPRTGGSRARERIVGSEIQGSLDGIEYQTVLTIDEEPPYGYSTFEILSDGFFRFIRFVGSKDSQCRLAELEFYGVKYFNDSLDVGTCNITLTVGSEEVLLENGFYYTPEATGNVTSIVPSTGTTAGGTEIVISGSIFSDQRKAISVIIDDIPCEVQTASSTEILCITGPRPVSEVHSFSVYIANSGYAATNGHEFLYTEKWSESRTWGGTLPPREGDSVVIPTGKHILLDTSPPQLYAIIIEGVLEFEDLQDLHLQASYIFIRNGSLRIGSKSIPFTHKAVITLHGHPETHPELPLYGAKNIAVRRGSLDLHGLPKTPTWTKLKQTVFQGDSTLLLEEETNWAVGDVIVIASTSYDFREAEELTIVAVEEQGTLLTVTPTLKYKHLGEVFTYGEKKIEIRAEVGVLTRNVVVRGDADSAKTQWGGQVMLHAPNEGTTIGRLENTEFTLCGQAFALGRYPIHFHLLRNVKDSYVRGCSIHHTFNRAVTFHGVSYFTVENNVAYDVMGHAFFLEDGAEERNRIVNNLGLVTRSSHSLLDTDVTPATFWITNPSNYIVGNRAAGSERYGFWFDLPVHPTGASFTTVECPPGKPLGVFSGNVAHSNGRYGLRIFNHFVPRQDHCNFGSKDNTHNPTIPAVFTDFVSFKNKRNGVVCSLIGDVEFRDFSLADNLRTGLEVVKVNSPLGGAKTLNSLIVAQTEDDLPQELRDDPDRGSTFGFIVSGATFNYTIQETTFVNFNKSHTFALGSCSHCNFPNNKNNDAKITSFKNISFVNSPSKVKWGFPYKHTFLDMDGTLSEMGVAGMWITTDWAHLRPHCTQLTSIDGWPGSLRCSPEHDIVSFAVHSQQPFSYFENDPLWIRTVQEINSANDSTPQASDWSEVPYRGKKFQDPQHGWAIPVLSGFTYEVHWSGVDFSTLTLEASALLPGRAFYIRVNYTEYRDHFKVFVRGREIFGSTIALPLPTSQTGISYHDVANKTLTILFTGRDQVGFGNTQVVRVEADKCPREGCPEPEYIEIEREPFIRMWSNASQWPGGRVPRSGEDVEIEEPWRMVMDIQPPQLGVLLIKGQLSFSSMLEETILEAMNILILGGELVAGIATLPFTKRVTIRLLGDRSSFPLIVDETIDAGPKALVALGKLKLHGQRRGVIWTRLSNPVAPLDDILSLETAVDWQEGEEILITSSSHDQREAETGRIKRKIDDQSFQLEQPLTHAHYGGVPIETSLSGKTVDVRAEVALLSRNIKITASQTSDKFGFHLFAGKLVSEEASRIFSGSIQLNGVELTNGGHFQTVRNTLDLINANGTNSYIEKSSFHHNRNTAILLKDTSNIKIRENIIYDTIGSSIDILESHNVQLISNLACLVKRRVDSPGHEVFEALGNFLICTWDIARNQGTTKCENIILQDNVAAGSYHISFAIHGSNCDADSDVSGSMNTAHSSRVGVLGFASDTSCILLSGFQVHHTVEAGITLNSNTARVVVNNVVLSDNLVGISLLPANGEDAGTTEIKDAVVVGYSENGGCGYDESIPCRTFAASRQTSVGKRNIFAKPGGDLVFSGCGHRVGIMTSVFDAVAKGYPRSVPLHLFNEVKSDSGFGGAAYLYNVLFQNWTVLDECGFHNSAISTNPSSSDATPVHYLRSIEFDRCDKEAIIYMDSPDPDWVNPEDCVDMDCTGLWNTAFVDEDGSVISIRGQIVPNYPSSFESDPRCELNWNWNAFVCNGTGYEALFFESLDVDRFTRRVHPINVSSLDDSSYSILNSYMDRRWDDDYTSLLRLSRFPVIVQRGQQYFINFTGTIPRTMRFAFGEGLASGGVIVHLKYDSPELHRVFVSKKEVSSNPEPLTLSDSSGANFWNNTDRTLSLAIKEGSVTIQTINAVQVTLTLTATIDEFYDQGGTAAFVRSIAYTLNIPSSRIRVIEVVSTASRRKRTRLLLNSQIVVDFAVMEDTTNTTNSEEELVTLSEEITQRAQVNALFMTPPGEEAFSLEISDVSVLLSLPPPSPCIPSCKNRVVDDASLQSQCVSGVCQCLREGYTYVQRTTLEDLLDDNRSTLSDGCYSEEEKTNDGFSNTKIIIVVVCVLVVLLLLGIGGAFMWKLKSRRNKKDLLFQNNPVFSDDREIRSNQDRIKVALPKITSQRRIQQPPSWRD